MFTRSLTGRGTAAATFVFTPLSDEDEGVMVTATQLRYDFADETAPVPVPEPATILLCGLGTTWLAVRRRRGR